MRACLSSALNPLIKFSGASALRPAFVLTPAVCLLVAYLAIAAGFMLPFSAVQVLWPTPPILSGFLLAGWQGAAVQVLCLVLSCLIYLPFVRAQDKVYCQAEAEEKEKDC